MACKKIQHNNYKVCSSNLRSKIEIQFPVSVEASNPDSTAESVFKEIKKTVYAMIKTSTRLGGVEGFGGTNISQSVNLDFYIRYDASIDLEKQIWVLFNNVRYKIVVTENIDHRNKTIRLGAVQRGNKSLAANQR